MDTLIVRQGCGLRRDGRRVNRQRIGIAHARIYAVVRRIPRGRVATYGQIARLAGLAGHARQVGYALHALPDASPIPWHRVVNAKGMVSLRATWGAELEQRLRLEAEGIEFDQRGRLRLARFQWKANRGRPRRLDKRPGELA